MPSVIAAVELIAVDAVHAQRRSAVSSSKRFGSEEKAAQRWFQFQMRQEMARVVCFITYMTQHRSFISK
jgi:hypothetical protein